MQEHGRFPSAFGLEHLGIENPGYVWWNLSTPALYEHAVRRGEATIAHLGPLVTRTGQYTGRSPNDKFVVREPSSEERIWWENNPAMDPEAFDGLWRRVRAYLQGKELFVQDCHVGADPRYRVPLRVISECAWHSLFARNMFLQAGPEELASHRPELTVIQAPQFRAVPEADGTNSGAFIILHLGQKLVLIGGTPYAGEAKKSVFSVMNYLLPLQGVLPMHCSANVGPEGDVALFFGLSGTGKTTLSASPDRRLVGDDEHGWSDQGIFNLEGGCYAKTIGLSPEAEPEIYEATRRFGTILENVAMDAATRRPDLNDGTLTENTRGSYPIAHIPNAIRHGTAEHPANVIMLTADAFGVLPPVAKLTPQQAMFHFLLGYTAKVAGTERGIVEPQATFSACFGAPFMTHHPEVYARLLADRIKRHDAHVWLVNTGWTGGPYGEGHRISIAHTRAVIRAILDGTLREASAAPDPVFGLHVPSSCPDVPSEVLRPRDTWRSPEAYDQQAAKLANMFDETGVEKQAKAAAEA
jgi:phosphoenolpyruvate carboxykinase (ATP)